MNLSSGANLVIRSTVILDLLQAKFGTDYQVSKALGKHVGCVSAYRRRGGVLSDEIGLKAAHLLDFPADMILLSLAAERALNSDNMQEIMRLAQAHTPPEISEQLEQLSKPSNGD